MSEKQIPDSWADCTVGDVLELKNGYAFKSNEFVNTGHKVVRISNIQDGRVDLTGCVCIKNLSNHNKFEIKDGDLLIAMSGATTGKMGIFNSSEIALQNQRVGNIKIKSIMTLDQHFRNHYFRYKQADILREAYGGAQPNISGIMIEKLNFPLPPLAEQKRIAAKIESTQEKIKTIESSITKAEELIKKYRESLLQKAFRGELIPQDPNDEPASKLLERIRNERAKQTDGKKKKKAELPPIKPEEIPFEIPASWEWVRFGDLGEFISGFAFKSSDLVDKDTGLQLVRIGNVTIDGLDLSKSPAYLPSQFQSEYRDFLIENGDLLISLTGTIGKEDYGNAVLIKTEHHIILNQRVLAIRSKISEFLNYYLKTRFFLDQFYGISNGQRQANVSAVQIKTLLVPLPPLNEQTKIQSVLAKLLSEISKMKSSAQCIESSLSHFSNSILACAFSGQLVPQDSTEGTGHELLAKIQSVIPKQTEHKISKKKSAPKKKKAKK